MTTVKILDLEEKVEGLEYRLQIRTCPQQQLRFHILFYVTKSLSNATKGIVCISFDIN